MPTRKLTVNIEHINPLSGDTFGYQVINNGNPLTFTGGTGWDKTFVTSGEELIEMKYIGQFTSGLTINNDFSHFNGIVYDSAVQTDGKLIVVGDFTEYSGISTPRIARFNTDGTLDTLPNLGTGPNNTVRAITLGSGNEIYIGGDFTAVGTNLVNRICRLTNAGSPNLTFISIVMGSGTDKGFNDSVRALTYYNGGLYVGGKFTKFQGTNRNRLIRLNTNGSEDTSLVINDGFTNVSNDSLTVINSILVRTITVLGLPSTRLIIGGLFSKYKTTTECNNIVKLQTNGTLDVDFNQGIAGSGTNGVVNKIIGTDSNNLVIGGEFTTFDSVASRNIVLSQNDGFIVPANVFDDGFDLGGQVKDIIENGDNFVVGGDMIGYQGLNCGNLVTIDKSSGSLVDDFKVNNTINALSLNGSDVIAVGEFTNYTTTSGNPNGTFLTIPLAEDSPIDFGSGFNSNTTTSVIHNGVIYVGGSFTDYYGETVSGIIALNLDGSIHTEFNTGTGFGTLASVYKMVIYDEVLYVVGNFGSYNGTSTNRIIALNLDGSIHIEFDYGTAFNVSNLYTLTAYNDKLYVGGSFTTYKGTTSNRIISLNLDGSINTTFNIGSGINSGTGFGVWDIKVNNDIVYAVGSFTAYNGNTANRIVAINLDGSIYSGFTSGAGFDSSTINTINVYDNIIYVGGNFTTYQGVSANRIIALNLDGSRYSTFDIGTGFDSSNITDIKYYDNILYVGGNFTTYKGITANKIIALNLDGSKYTDFDNSVGANNFINFILKQDSIIYIGGSFTSYNGDTANRIVGLDVDGSIAITITALPQIIQNTYNNLVEFNSASGITYSIDNNFVVMEYDFDEEEIVLASVYDTPDHVEITYVNESEPITAYVTDIVVRSPHFIFSTESNFDYTTFNVKAWEGNIFSGASEPILYTITKQKLLSIQNNIFVNINNYVKEKLEANVISFFDTEYLIAQDLPEGLSKWVEVETTTYYSGSSVSTNIERLFCTDGYIYPTEVQNIPNVLVTGTKRYISRNQLQRIYFKTYDLISIEAIYYDMFNSPTSFDITFAEQVYLNNQYVQTIALPPLTNINRIEYTFSYGSEVSVITYYVYDECLYDNYTIIYKNKWGVLESIPMTKKHSKQLTVSSNDLNRSIVDYNGNYYINRHTKKQFNTQGNETYILNTEYLPEYMNQAIEELMLSEEIWLYKDNVIIPCLRKEDSINYKTKLNDKLIQYTMSVELSHNTIKNIL